MKPVVSVGSEAAFVSAGPRKFGYSVCIEMERMSRKRQRPSQPRHIPLDAKHATRASRSILLRLLGPLVRVSQGQDTLHMRNELIESRRQMTRPEHPDRKRERSS